MTVGILLTTLLVLGIEGAVSLVTGRSLLRRPFDSAARWNARITDQQQATLARLSKGPYDLDADPRVGHRCKLDDAHDWHGVTARTDSLGGRRRPSGWPEEDDRPRWVVLGDSVAFGFGLGDDETYAARLEHHAADALAPAAARPAVLTLATPGWNLAASARAMRNHAHRYRPDLVVLIPVVNDLGNRSAVDAAGQRADRVDPTSGILELPMQRQNYVDLYLAIGSRTPLPRLIAAAESGGLEAVEHALNVALAPTSLRRWRQLVGEVRELDRFLRARDCDLFVALPWANHFHRELEARLLAEAPEVRYGFLFDGSRPGDTLGDDPHPNAACVDAGARRILELLQAADLPRGADWTQPVPSSPEYATRTAQRLAPVAAQALRGERHALYERFSGPRIALADATGFHQVYAGIGTDGTIGRDARVALRTDRPTSRLRLHVRGLLGGQPVQGLRIGVSVQSDPDAEAAPPQWTEVPLEAHATTESEGVLEIPLDTAPLAPGWIDVQLIASDHLVETVDGRSRPASFRFEALELLP